jgi:hypothetical protein
MLLKSAHSNRTRLSTMFGRGAARVEKWKAVSESLRSLRINKTRADSEMIISFQSAVGVGFEPNPFKA